MIPVLLAAPSRLKNLWNWIIELIAPMTVPSNPTSPEHMHTMSTMKRSCSAAGEKGRGPGSAARAIASMTARSWCGRAPWPASRLSMSSTLRTLLVFSMWLVTGLASMVRGWGRWDVGPTRPAV
jgi:hypothetical protein